MKKLNITVFTIGLLFLLSISLLPQTVESDSNNNLTQINSNISGTVAIFKDYNAWGANGTEEILESHLIPYVVYSSLDIGIVDISLFEKVIIESEQSFAFNDAVTNNRPYFESYVFNGGILEIHAATNSAWNNILPGGFLYVNEYPESIEILDTNHPILNSPAVITDEELDNWGSSAHGTLQGQDPGDKNILAAEGSLLYTKSVLLESYYGDGSFIVSSQTLEYGYFHGYSTILENILLHIPQGISKANIVDTPLILSNPGDININQGDPVSLSWVFSNPQPDMYYIYLDYDLVTSGLWVDLVAISYNPLSLPLGEHEITIMVSSFNGKSTFHSIKVGVDDGFAPTLVSYNDVYNFEYGTQDNNVMWIYSDALPNDYEIYVNGAYYQWGEWTSDNPILFNIDYWQIGEYNVSIKVYDKRYIISESWSWVYIADTTSPNVSTPENIEMEEGSVGMYLIWEVYDLTGGTWQVDLDNGFHSDGNFNEGMNEILVNLDDLPLGLHTFILNVFDYSGNYATDEVVVNVVEVSKPPASTTPPVSTTPPASTTPPQSSSNPPPDGEESSSQPSLPIPFSSNIVIGFTLFFVTASIRMKRR